MNHLVSPKLDFDPIPQQLGIGLGWDWFLVLEGSPSEIGQVADEATGIRISGLMFEVPVVGIEG